MYASDFSPPPTGFYCSSLVTYAYRRALGRPHDNVFLDRPFPLIFVPLAFWESWYKALVPPQHVPVNVTGSNPTELLHSPAVDTHPRSRFC